MKNGNNKLNVTHTRTRTHLSTTNYFHWRNRSIHVPGWPLPTLSDVNKNSSGLRVAILTRLEANVRYLHIAVAWLPNSWSLLNLRIGQNAECRTCMVEFIPDLLCDTQNIASWHLPVRKRIKMQTTNLQWFAFEWCFMLHCRRERLYSVSCDHACISFVFACISTTRCLSFQA